MSSALNYTGTGQDDFNSNHTSSTQYNATGCRIPIYLPNTVYPYDADSRLTSTFDSATGITTTYTCKPYRSHTRQETVASSVSPATFAVYGVAAQPNLKCRGLAAHSVRASQAHILDYLSLQGVEIGKTKSISDLAELFTYIDQCFDL